MRNGHEGTAVFGGPPLRTDARRFDLESIAGWFTGRALIVGLAALPLAVVLGLLVVIVWSSVVEDITSGFTSPFTLRHYREFVDDPLVYTALENTAGFVLVTIIVAMSFGVAAAWLVERTDLPGKKTVYSLMTAVLLLPSIFIALGWMFLMHPRIGVLNTWLMRTFELRSAPLSIANVFGMGWVEGLGLASARIRHDEPDLARAQFGA